MIGNLIKIIFFFFIVYFFIYILKYILRLFLSRSSHSDNKRTYTSSKHSDNKKLSKTKKEQISRLLIFDAKTFEKINAKSEIFRELKIKEPDWIRKKEVNNFNKQISDYFKLYLHKIKYINDEKIGDNRSFLSSGANSEESKANGYLYHLLRMGRWCNMRRNL